MDVEATGAMGDDALRPYPLSRVARSATYQRLRTILDPVAAGLLVVALSPLFLIVALAVAIDGGFPVLFTQQRLGRYQRPFNIFKFRTMTNSAPKYSLKVGLSDPRITRVGRFLRRSGLDEMPQLFNVVRGEMALIGPRPEQAALADKYQGWQLARFAVKPGLTGWWQVHHRDNVPMHVNVEADIHYLENFGPNIDVRIVWLTLVVLFTAMVERQR